MKKLIMMTLVLAAAVVHAGEMSLADARAKIGDAVAAATQPGSTNATQLTSIMKQLSPENQKKFVADVNESISKLPGSAESKAAAFLNANKAMMRGASDGNMVPVLAEVYATVPPEALTVVSESFGDDLFNRATDSSKSYSDAQFQAIAESTMKTIHERNASSDDAAVRDAFAILMFVRASNGTPSNLADTLVKQMDPQSQDVASREWIPAALGKDGQEKTYAPMLGASDAGLEPNVLVTMQIAGPQTHEAMLADLYTGTDSAARAPFSEAREASTQQGLFPGTEDGGADAGLSRSPVTPAQDQQDNPQPTPEPEPGPGPRPYQNQGF